MSNIHKILDFAFPKYSFSDKGQNVIPANVLNLCHTRIATLNSISDEIGNSMIDEKPTSEIRDIYLKFIRLCNSNQTLKGQFDKRELRTLSYSLNYKEHKQDTIFLRYDYLNQCLTLLDNEWRDSFMSGLLDCYLSNWKSNNRRSFNRLSKFLTSKIRSYKGTRSLFQALKANPNYFDQDKGDLELGATLAISNKNLCDVTKYLSLPDHWITYPYFSGVINGYVDKSKNRIEEILTDISSTLEKHSSSTKATNTNKLVVSKVICYTNNSNENVQDKVKEVAFKLVGDPGITSLWRPFEGASQADIYTINKARNILNEWVTREFIKVFFEKCINDSRRKRFWLQYSKKISEFKVFGPSHIKSLLKSDRRISEYVDGRFESVYSKKNVSAFLFRLGNYKMIEFSDPGYAFYAYKANSRFAPSFDAKYISSVDEFRNGLMSRLIKRTGYQITDYSFEGRLPHNDGDLNWEDVFSYWIKNIAKIDV